MNDQAHPTPADITDFKIATLQGIEVGLGADDPLAQVSKKLQDKYPGHMVMVQAGKFLHAYNQSAYALHVLKPYKLKLVGTTAAPHIRVGFPVSNHKRRLWSLVDQFDIPYVVALGSHANGYTLYLSSHGNGNASILASASDDVVHQVIADLQAHKQLNRAQAQKLLANPETAPFQLKAQAQELDTQILQDIIKLPRDIRATWGENVRQCMARLMRGVFLYGQEDNKPQLLKQLSADADLLKYYIAQGQQLNRFKISFEHRARLAVDLGRLIGGLMRAKEVTP